MSKPRVIVLRTAGTNCDREAAHACTVVGAEVELVHIRTLLGDPDRLDRYHWLIVPGGFSYGDDLGAGRILANEIRYRLRDAMLRFVADGKLVLGICNGFQILAKAGILPGDDPAGRQTVTLATNDSNRFEDRWIHLEAVSDRCAFVDKGDRLYLPVAHGEGKFVPRDAAVLRNLEQEERIVFRYVVPDGGVQGGDAADGDASSDVAAGVADAEGRRAPYPFNPNGSVADIAGITNATGRVLGLMPHPERHVYRLQHPFWTRLPAGSADGDGLRIFQRAVRVAQAELV